MPQNPLKYQVKQSLGASPGAFRSTLFITEAPFPVQSVEQFTKYQRSDASLETVHATSLLIKSVRLLRLINEQEFSFKGAVHREMKCLTVVKVSR